MECRSIHDVVHYTHEMAVLAMFNAGDSVMENAGALLRPLDIGVYASQPAVSIHIKTLEEELGVSLFVRTPKGMVLTQDGRQLKEHADKALAILDDMMCYAGEQRSTLTGLLKIGINTEPAYLRISELFSTMKTHCPKLRIHLLQSMTGEILNKLEEGILDAGFMYGENSSDKISASELQQFKLVVAGPIAWRDKL